MKGIAMLLLVLLLAGCCAAKPVPPPQVVTKVVTVPCKTAPVAEPAYAYDLLPAEAYGRLDPQVQALLIEREQRRAEARELRAAVQACQ